MTEVNVEIVRGHYASFSLLAEGNEIDSHVLSYFDPNCEYMPVEEIDAIRGHEALIEITDGGELVIAAISTSGRGRTSGVEIRQRFFHVFEMREGRILRQREYLDLDSAIEAAGLSE